MPLLLHRRSPSGAITGIWKLDEPVYQMKDMIKLRSEEEEIYATFVHENRRKQWLGIRLLLKEVLPDVALQIEYDENEKPFLKDSTWKISISHSRNKAAILLHPRLACGIDIEHMHARIEKVAEKFLCNDELEFVQGKNFTQSLHVCWGIKEALYKMAGWKGMIFAEDMRIRPFTFSTRGTAEACICKGKKEDWFTLNFETVNDYILVTTIKQK
ncbi:MAG: 4'-phosphopantetheinyl transferase superfamily protein [Bacteroidota bacterium]